MKHVKLFEQFVNEKKELYTAYIEDGREPGGTDKEIKKDYNLEVTNRTKDGFDVIGAKQDVEDFIEEYGIITDVTVYESIVNEGYYSSSDIKKLKAFAKEVSEEIIYDYTFADRRYFKAKDYSPKQMFDYISEWGEINNMSAEEVIAEFNWNSMTDELGLPRE